MRIALVCPYSFDRPGGVQNNVLGTAAWLRASGHEVEVAGSGSSAGMLGLGRGVPIGFNGSVARIALRPDVPARLRRWASGFEVVHVHEPLVPLAGLAMFGWAGAKVATFHAATSPRVRRVSVRWLSRWGSAPCVAVSEVAAVTPRAAGLDVTLIGNGIDVASFDATATRSVQILAFGRDEPRKGLPVLREATTLLPGVQVVIGGASTPIPADEQRNALLSAAQVFVAPHLGGESFGIVLLEALASGADVVASDLPAFRALLTDSDGLIARLVPPGDPGALAEALRDALESGPVASQERRRALAARYDWSQIGPQLVSRYEASLRIA